MSPRYTNCRVWSLDKGDWHSESNSGGIQANMCLRDGRQESFVSHMKSNVFRRRCTHDGVTRSEFMCCREFCGKEISTTWREVQKMKQQLKTLHVLLFSKRLMIADMFLITCHLNFRYFLPKESVDPDHWDLYKPVSLF